MHEIGFHMSRLSRTLRVSAMPNNFTGSKAVTVQMKMKPSRLCEVLPEGWHISSQSTCFPSRAPIYHPAHSLKCLDVRSASCFPATSISVLSLHLSASRNFFSSPTQDILHNKICWYACFYLLKIFILFIKPFYYQNVIALLLALLGLLLDHVNSLRHWLRHQVLCKRDKWTIGQSKTMERTEKTIQIKIPQQTCPNNAKCIGVNIWCLA